MIKKLILLVLLFAIPAVAQEPGVFPNNSPIMSKSIGFTEKLNRVAPFIFLKQGAIVSAQNMRRPAPGIPAGWGPRRGMEKNNSTAISSAAIDTLHQYINPTFGTRCFIAQTNDKLYLAFNDPPSAGTTFGTELSVSLSAGTGDLFSDSVGDDFVAAGDLTAPMAWSGGLAYPDGFKIVIGGASPDSISITNDDFETGNDPPTGWTESNATAVSGTTAPQGGSKDVEVTSTVAGSASAGIYQDIAAAPGVEYTISYWARRDSLVTSSITNDDFETGGTPPTGWTNSNATSISGTTSPHAGLKDAEVTPTAANSESAGIYQDIAVNASTGYTLSYWAYRENQVFEFTNGDFETGSAAPPTGWAENDATAVTGTTSPHGGSNDVEVTSTAIKSSKAGVYQDITVEPDVEYTLTSWAYRTTEIGDSITNGDFESGTTGWTATNGSIASGTTDPHGGSKDLEVTNTSTSSYTAGGYQRFNVLGSTGYTLNYWAYRNRTGTGSVTNGTFDSDISGWTEYDPDDVLVPSLSDGGVSGNCMKLVTTSGSEYKYMYQDVSVSPDSYLTLTFYCYQSTSPPDMTVVAYVKQYDSGDNLLSTSGGTKGYPTSWEKCTISATILSTTSYVRITLGNDDGGAGDIFFDNVTVSVLTQQQPAVAIVEYNSGDSVVNTTSEKIAPETQTWDEDSLAITTDSTTSYVRVYLSTYSAVASRETEFDDVTFVRTSPTSGNPLAGITVEAYTSGNALISTPVSTTHNPSTNTWTSYDDTFTTPVDTSYIRAYLASNSDAVGQVVEFDDITIAPTSEAYPQTNPSHVMQALDSGHSVLSTFDTQENNPTGSTWTKYSENVITPVACAYIRLYLGAKAPSADFLNTVEFDDVEIATTSGGPFPSHVMQFLDGASAVLETASTQNNEPTVGEWVQYSAQGISPATTAFIRLYLGCNSTPLGETVQFDTLTSIVAVPPAGLDVTDGYAEVRNNLTTRYIFRRPVDGVHFYIGGTPNSAVESMSVYYWKGASSTWNPVGNLSDGTAISSATLAQSGSMTWDTGPLGETPRVLLGTSDDLYWYKFTPSGDLSSGLTVYKITVSDDMSEIANLWSGYSVLASSVLLDEGSGYADYGAEVTDGTDVNVMPLDSLANTSEVYFGFVERAQGINIYMVAGKGNSNATVVTVKYWDGDSWVSVGTLVDGTSNGTDSLAQNGMIQWDGDAFREIKMVLGGLKVPYYWYQLSWSNALDAEVEVWEVSYAAKPDPLEKYVGMVSYNNYALWWPGLGGAGTVDYSQQGYAHIMNGPYSGTTLPIFGGGEVNAITMLGTSAIVSTKNPYKIFFLHGATPDVFMSNLVSDRVGAMAPKTLISIDSGVTLFNRDTQVRGVVFMAADGVYMTDGSTLFNISTPIADYFSTASSPYIEPEYMDTSYAWIDHEEKTVHFAVPMNVSGSGTQSVLNRELVYAYLTDEWYDIYQRDAAVNCGLDVIGSSNEYLTYVGGFLGHVYRANTGTSDSGTKITHNFKTAPIMPMQGLISNPINYSSTLRRIKIKGKADITDNAVAGVTVFPDGKSTGVDAGDISLENPGYSNVAGAVNVSQTGDEFAFEFESDLLNAEMELYGITIDFMPQRPE